MSKNTLSACQFEFDDYQLDQNGDLCFNGTVIPVPPKELEVLKVLLQAKGAVVTKDDFLDRIWGHIAVGEESLTRCIYSLRKILKETTGNKYIQTIYGKGYRFCKAVKASITSKDIWASEKLTVCRLKATDGKASSFQPHYTAYLSTVLTSAIGVQPTLY